MSATTYQVTIGARVLRVEVRRQAAQTFVRVDDGDEQPAESGTVRGPLRWLRLGERRTELLASVASDGAALTIGGFEFRAQVVDDAHARLASVAGSRQGSQARHELKAPMPGLLVKLLCEPGDIVEAGQPLAILQAMKMENELSLPRGGTVRSVAVQPGQTVEQGEVLLVVE